MDAKSLELLPLLNFSLVVLLARKFLVYIERSSLFRVKSRDKYRTGKAKNTARRKIKAAMLSQL